MCFHIKAFPVIISMSILTSLVPFIKEVLLTGVSAPPFLPALIIHFLTLSIASCHALRSLFVKLSVNSSNIDSPSFDVGGVALFHDTDFYKPSP